LDGITVKPPTLNFVTFPRMIKHFVNYVTQLTTIPVGITANIKMYIGRTCEESRESILFSSKLPVSQLLFEGSGQVTIPCVKLRDIVIQGLKNDVAVMTNCQCGGMTKYMVKYAN